MSVTLNEASRALIDGVNFASIATINPDGSPQTSVVWVTRDGDDLLFSTVIGRRKERNLRRDPRVSVTIFDQQQPYSYIEVRGSVTLDPQGGRELIDALSNKYVGRDYDVEPETNVRVVIRLTPQKVTGNAA
ncbi:PPOX class F420-dependent oxidoreductase [Kutzneria sp. CA-103260]|uniref:PPOX class F420-dependent oxidoreductase n=1 Tax=Kutzneria sp. CA-103260 TaxID=2802641 RepID=UPI001BAB6408|nr:PPOX class F420-dependent oxidoreductase [Kutzneria sp. CA-103260]QUQ69619.1 PPOX class F420-dependent oxidoreductase [Kutzneria sp. CA-103260]